MSHSVESSTVVVTDLMRRFGPSKNRRSRAMSATSSFEIYWGPLSVSAGISNGQKKLGCLRTIKAFVVVVCPHRGAGQGSRKHGHGGVDTLLTRPNGQFINSVSSSTFFVHCLVIIQILQSVISQNINPAHLTRAPKMA